MSLELLCERMDDELMRISQMVLLAGVLCDDPSVIVSEGMESFFDEQISEPKLSDMFGEIPQYVFEGYKSDRSDRYIFLEWLRDQGKYGYLIKFSTPVIHDGAFRWGRYISSWVYSDTLDGAVKNGFSFVKTQRRKEKSN